LNGAQYWPSLLKEFKKNITKLQKNKGLILKQHPGPGPGSDDDDHRFDYYDNGPVTPPDKDAPDVKVNIAKMKAIQEKVDRQEKPQ